MKDLYRILIGPESDEVRKFDNLTLLEQWKKLMRETTNQPIMRIIVIREGWKSGLCDEEGKEI
jgi:hypothetical protein